MLVALIMAGGSGERFWPLSRKEKPKQLLKLFSNKSMIRETVDRILPIISPDKIFVATNSIQVKGIKEELPFLADENIIVEPMMKDTAACIGYSSIVIKKKFPNATMVVLPSDHLIELEQTFRDTLEKAQKFIENGSKIITLGISPDSPKTSYGYIEVAKEELEEKKELYSVKGFHEKPNEETAEYYLEKRNYLWNSGMFIWKVDGILSEIAKYLPNHYFVLESIDVILDEGIKSAEKFEKIKTEFEKFEKISIDFGVMEKTEHIEVIPTDIGWNDVGNYTALLEILKKNKNGTVVKNCNLIEINSSNNIIIGNNDKIIAAVGVDNLIIAESEAGLLICDKSKASHIKKVVKEIKKF
jgi:mannose-1-phosphate guanylyltransferase